VEHWTPSSHMDLLWELARLARAKVSSSAGKIINFSCLQDGTAVRSGAEIDILSIFDLALLGWVIRRQFVYSRLP